MWRSNQRQRRFGFHRDAGPVTKVLASPDARTVVPPSRVVTDVPRLLRWVSLGVVLAGAVMSIVGAFRTGVTWDEPFHVMRLRNYLDHGSFGLDWSTSQSDAESNTVVYGPVAMLLLHALGALVGVEHWSTVATTPAAYDVRHLGVALIGLVGTAAAAATTRILLGSWRWALVTAAALLALPMWTGHLMFNVKDVPVATGFTLTTLALVAMVAPVQASRLARVACLAGGVVLMVGTRPAMFSAVLAALVVLAVGVLATGRFGNARTALAEAGTGVLVAAVVLLAVYPTLFSHPGNLLRAAEKSSNFRDGTAAAYGYVPFHVAAQAPLLLQTFFVIGLVTLIGFSRSHWRTDTAQVTRYALVASQLLTLPVVAIVRHSDLYNALRQLLFACPAWAILATVGIARAITWSREHGRVRTLGVVTAAALVLPVLDQLSLFPYQYTYYNVALDATGVHVPSDYWRASTAELLAKLPTDGQIVCSPTRATTSGAEAGTPAADAVDPSRLTAYRFAQDTSVDCRTDVLGPLASRWSASGMPVDDRLPHDEFYAVIDRGHQTPQNCTRIASVDRTRHLRQLSMTYVARCRLQPSRLDAAGVRFVRTPGNDMLATLWTFAPQGWVARGATTAITAPGSSATLTFRTPESCVDQDCALELGAFAPTDLMASVNGATAGPVERAADGSLLVRLPVGTTSAWVTFTRTSGEPLDVRLHQLRVIRSRNGLTAS